jgi:nifR3 family TIM-barrel protein
MNFWEKLEKPIFALAPMEAVTDTVFREIFAMYGKPDVCFTEFVNVDGLLHPTGYEKLKIDLEYTEKQRPVVAQIWGNNPENFFKATQLIKSLGFDGVDINMGCPQDKEIAQNTCAALIRDPKLAGEIVMAVKEAAGELPVSVKTRTGYSVPEVETWIGHLLKFNLAALTLHGRTKKEKSKVPANWNEIKKAVDVRNNLGLKTIILGNGDVKTRQEGLDRVKETGVDGVMVARGAFGNPWLFKKQKFTDPTVKERLEVMVEHARLFEKKFLDKKPFVIMRKNFKAYATGFDGALNLRVKLMETKNAGETALVVEEFLEKRD